MCDKRRDLENVKNTTRTGEYREIHNKKFRNLMNKTKEELVDKQRTVTKGSLSNSNSRRTYRVVKDLTQQARVNNIEDKDGKRREDYH